MGRGGERRGAARPRRGRGRVLLAGVLVVALVAAGLGAWRLGLLDELTDGGADRAGALPTAPAPDGLSLPTPREVEPVLAPTAEGTPRRSAVRAAVLPVLARHDFGPHVGVAVAGLDGSPAWATGADPFTPASTMKNLTALAALESLGDDAVLTTRVTGDLDPRRGPADVVLVGGGDPLLARGPLRVDGSLPADAGDSSDDHPEPATLAALVSQTATSLREAGVRRVRVSYDDGLFVGPSISPRWEPGYAVDVVTPISALWVEGGTTDSDLPVRVPDPAAAATRDFAAALASTGITVVGDVARVAGADGSGGAVARTGTELAAVDSPPLREVVARTLEVSDNEAAEVLARQVALSEGEPASFAGGAAAVTAVARSLGVDLAGARVLDGSGLSRDDRLPLATALQVLQTAAAEPALREVLSGLPVAGFDGSLELRFTDPAAADGLGVVRAKTGTLTGVHALAGITVDATGVPLVFVAVADRIDPLDTLDVRDGLDEVAAALTACRCSG